MYLGLDEKTADLTITSDIILINNNLIQKV